MPGQPLEAFDARQPDLVLLDVMMPGMDGFGVCREIRARSLTPVIMITARSDDEDRILGLDTGADDYVVKPFSPGEVMARVRAVLRRVAPPAQPDVFRCGGLKIDLQTFGVRVAGQPGRDFEIRTVWGVGYQFGAI